MEQNLTKERVLREILEVAARGNCYACGFQLSHDNGCKIGDCSFRPSDQHITYPNWRSRFNAMRWAMMKDPTERMLQDLNMQEGRIPDLEPTRRNAEYWAVEAEKASDRSMAMACAANAMFAWRNAAYAMADQRDNARATQIVNAVNERVREACEELLNTPHQENVAVIPVIPSVSVLDVAREIMRLHRLANDRRTGMEQALTFAAFSTASRARADRWHKNGIEEWSESEWTNAMGGEAGETAAALVRALSMEFSTAITALTMLGHAGESMNAGKKLLRLMKGNQQKDGDSSVPKNIQEARAKVAKEIGDTVSYCDLVCYRIGWTLEDALRYAFNAVSEREGFPERI